MIMQDSSIEFVQADDRITHIALGGFLDMTSVNRIKDRVTAHIVARCRATILDLGRVDFIASRGARMLLVNARALRRHGKKLVLLRPNPLVRETLCVTGIDQAIPIAESREEALEMLL